MFLESYKQYLVLSWAGVFVNKLLVSFLAFKLQDRAISDAPHSSECRQFIFREVRCTSCETVLLKKHGEKIEPCTQIPSYAFYHLCYSRTDIILRFIFIS